MHTVRFQLHKALKNVTHLIKEMSGYLEMESAADGRAGLTRGHQETFGSAE